MKTNLKRLELINVDLFFVVSIWENEIYLQGNVSIELINYCVKELGMKLETTEQGWLKGELNSIELGNLKITLT